MCVQLHLDIIAAKDAATAQQYQAEAAVARARDELADLQFLAKKQRTVLQQKVRPCGWPLACSSLHRHGIPTPAHTTPACHSPLITRRRRTTRSRPFTRGYAP